MQHSPSVSVTRFAQLEPGALFLWRHREGSCVSIVADDQDGQKYIVPLGPAFPADIGGPSLVHSTGVTVVSFGKDYTLRLPVQPTEWFLETPPPNIHCILVADGRAYIRVNYILRPNEFSPCYVDLDTGFIFVRGTGGFREFVTPPGTGAFAIEWKIVTREEDPRVILAYP